MDERDPDDYRRNRHGGDLRGFEPAGQRGRCIRLPRGSSRSHVASGHGRNDLGRDAAADNHSGRRVRRGMNVCAAPTHVAAPALEGCQQADRRMAVAVDAFILVATNNALMKEILISLEVFVVRDNVGVSYEPS